MSIMWVVVLAVILLGVLWAFSDNEPWRPA